jgi:hypothetical protein
MSQSDIATQADLGLAVAHLETRMAELETRMVERFETTVHAQTRQMFNLLLPVYGGIIIGLLLFIASKVL